MVHIAHPLHETADGRGYESGDGNRRAEKVFSGRRHRVLSKYYRVFYRSGPMPDSDDRAYTRDRRGLQQRSIDPHDSGYADINREGGTIEDAGWIEHDAAQSVRWR